MMRTGIRVHALIAGMLAALVMGSANGWCAVRGRALLVEAPGRGKPGNLILCSLRPGQEPPKLEIVKATYGVLASNLTADVTEKVKGMLTPVGLSVAVDSRSLGDPARGKRKELKIEYTLNGRPAEQTRTDGGTIDIDLEKTFDTLVEGLVMAPQFSPDGKQVVYGIDGVIKVMNLETRASRDVCPYTTTNLTYVFNWTADNKIHWSDGPDQREIYAVDIETKEKKLVHKGNAGRTTISSDGKKAAWVIPPRCAFIGGKQYGYMGGCGGSVSPSGKYLTSNLTTSHKLMGIFEFGDNGPSEKPIATVAAVVGSINGFYFGRTDEWVCYTVEAPESISPIAYIAYWRTDDHIEIAKHYCIYDFFDETDVIPPGAELEGITVCAEGPVNTPLTNQVVNVGRVRPLKVVGHYKTRDGAFTPQLREGVTWKADASKVAVAEASVQGRVEAAGVAVTAEYKGKSYSFQVTVLPALTGDGFKAEYFGDYNYSNSVLTRVDRCLDFRWAGGRSPEASINKGRAPWSAQWTGQLDIQLDGDYVFSFLQGEGNDRWVKNAKGEKTAGWGVWIDDQVAVTLTRGNYPWAKPTAGAPLSLKKGRHSIKVMTVGSPSQPVVVQLFWSGPGIRESLLGGGYIHSGAAAEKTQEPQE